MSSSIVTRSMLFADVVGFSKMPDSAYPGFMREFLSDANALLSQPLHTALVRNTWGDAIFAVFECPVQAGHAAIALQNLVASVDWNARFGTPHDLLHLRLRIGLHAGPVHEGVDPITGGLSYVGRHTNLAARLEPIAEEGQVYVSGEFAAIATVARASEFQFDYVGQRPLPKNAGLIPVFRLSLKNTP
jgi:class 3 adenylate cyclase